MSSVSEPYYLVSSSFTDKCCVHTTVMDLFLQIHVFNVEMTCEGCSGAVERVLNRLKGQGVDNVLISLPDQKVSVTSTLSADQLLEVIKKTGKKTTYVGTQ